MLHEYLFGADHMLSLACQPPGELSILAVHEKRLVEKPSVIDEVFAKQEAAASEIVKAKSSRI
jgi:hypothetical protein